VTAMRREVAGPSGSAPTAMATATATARAEGARPTAETATPEAEPGHADPTSGVAVDDPGIASDGPCAEERRVSDERCAVASLARQGAELAATALHRAQRSYDEHVARADAAAAAADPRAVRTAKEQAQRQFHDARGLARTREDIESGARLWLAEINRINHDTRESALAAERDRAAAAALAANLERLAVEADATRISAEQADEACLAARQVVADCDESRQLAAAAAARASEPEPPPETDEPGRIAAATPEPEEEFRFAAPMGSRAPDDAPILRILRGDRDALQDAVARLAGDDVDARRRWQTRLGGLAEALIARSIEASSFEFPEGHPFWGPFSQSQNRDIAAALSSLGFRFDGFGDWVDDRVPSQRDLSMAVGYAGLDPMRVRRWPTEAETRELLRDIRVAADEYVAGAAGGMTLGELVTLLGRRADGLTEIWNEWGTVRPILLEAG
jgi:hypothetical protein